MPCFVGRGSLRGALARHAEAAGVLRDATQHAPALLTPPNPTPQEGMKVNVCAYAGESMCTVNPVAALAAPPAMPTTGEKCVARYLARSRASLDLNCRRRS